mmetsp:Transcript_5291/g.33241  ORF Transcript_5291/g.33241 Transcript_5291/m.33241 type:complete len:88 (-) Transcript_5291:1190-1453(-)
METGVRYYTRYQARLQERKEKAGLGLLPAMSSLEREEFAEKYFADAQQKEVDLFRKKWNFDPVKGCPISTHDGRYQWEVHKQASTRK